MFDRIVRSNFIKYTERDPKKAAITDLKYKVTFSQCGENFNQCAITTVAIVMTNLSYGTDTQYVMARCKPTLWLGTNRYSKRSDKVKKKDNKNYLI